MVIKVELLAFQDGSFPQFREVRISYDTPTECVLEEVYRLGQNDFQPNPHCYSVSVGDIIHLPKDGGTEYVLICGIGFKVLTEGQANYWRLLDQRSRSLHGMRAKGETDLPEINRFAIVAGEDVYGAPLSFWSNEFGWTSREEATVFEAKELYDIHLPMSDQGPVRIAWLTVNGLGIFHMQDYEDAFANTATHPKEPV